MLTNLGLLGFYGALIFVMGLIPLLAIALPVLILTSWIGTWLFFVQHQFEEVSWERNKNWNMQEAALMGSSYYVLPKILQWFSGNIGLHHIHHLCSQIPNYKLQACMSAYPALQTINRLTIRESLKSLSLKLWDEDKKQLVSFKDLKIN